MRPQYFLAALVLIACGSGGTSPDGGADSPFGTDGAPFDGLSSDTNDSGAGTRCAPLPPPAGAITMVAPSDAPNLPSIVSSAASKTTLVLADGTYALPGQLSFTQPDVTLRSQSNDASKVILDGQYMVDENLNISASNVTIAHVTIKRAVNHPIHVVTGNGNTIGTRIYGVHIEDGGQQFVKINSSDQVNWVDEGSVECSSFLMTAEGRTHVEPNFGGCYTGGIDGHGAKGWVVRFNRFTGIHCENGNLAEHAIHFWTGSRDTLVEQNVIIDCARGVGFGLGDQGGRTYMPDPYPNIAPIGHFDGIIRNNVIWATTAWFDTGISLEQAHGVKVFHNTVVSNPPQMSVFFSSIDYRFANTLAEIRNNLTTRITVRDGATGMLSNNLEMTPLTLFENPAMFSFELLKTATDAIDKGMVVSDPGLDIDGEPHTNGPPDIGADEYWP